jgi:integrase
MRLINMDMILEQFFKERNSSKSTQINYTRSIRYYEKLTGHTMRECVDIADDEEYNNIRWKNTQTRKWILEYREKLYEKYNVSTAQLYLTAVITVYRHFETTIPPLPYYSTKNLHKTAPINYNDLPDREILSACLQATSPLVRSLILFMSSSGISRIDVLNLTIGDYLEATSDYHDQDKSVKYAIRDMRDAMIVPTFHLTRQKTGQDYFTFCSHEAVKSINSYLLTRTEILHRDKPLFKIHERYINLIFERLNGSMGLGKVGNYNRLRPHMLRKYHASQLAEAGMSTEHINLLQGRKVTGIAHEHYIRIKPEALREEYIQALPYLVIEETQRYKTELETVKEENTQLHSELDGILERIKRLEERPSWEEFVNDPKH